MKTSFHVTFVSVLIILVLITDVFGYVAQSEPKLIQKRNHPQFTIRDQSKKENQIDGKFHLSENHEEITGQKQSSHSDSTIKSSHKCMHNDIQQDMRKTHVNYNSHPIERKRRLTQLEKNIANIDENELTQEKLSQIEDERRRLAVSSDEFSKIRITPYWDHLEATVSDSSLLTYIKELTSAAIEFFENSASVYPVDTALFLEPECSLGYYVNNYEYFNCATFETSSVCGHVTIPSSHFGTGWIYDQSDEASYYYTGGSGIVDTDLVIYVSANDSSCGEGTLAWATSCVQDQYGRPVAGAINFCTASLETKIWKLDVDTTLHELTHVLIMDPSIWDSFIDRESGAELNTSDIYTTVDGYTYIVTDKVKALAQSHYDCDTIIGLPVEDDGSSGSVGSHWEEYHVNTEYMIAVLYSSATYTSYFTFALMEDSGWYIVDYDYVEPFFWGYEEGCSFWDGTCIDSSSDESLFPQYFCDVDSSYGCTYEHSATAQCLLYVYGSIPSEFQWFSDSTYGGTEYSQFCPFYDPYVTNSDFYGFCWDTRGNNATYQNIYTSNYNVSYGLNSRCITTINQDGGSYNGLEYGLCFEHECYGYTSKTKDFGGVLTKNTGEWSGVLINIDDDKINCTRNDQGKTKYNSPYQINITCPDIDTVCYGETPFNCEWGYWNNDLDQCICSAGYEGTICDTQQANIVDGVTLYSGNTPSPTSPSDTVCVKSLTYLDESTFAGEWSADGIQSGLYTSYISPTSDYYLWFDTWYHQWTISTGFEYDNNDEAVGMVAYCNIGRFYVPDVTDCNQDWTVLDSNDDWQRDATMITKAGTCPSGVTPAPTDIDQISDDSAGSTLLITIGMIMSLLVVVIFV